MGEDGGNDGEGKAQLMGRIINMVTPPREDDRKEYRFCVYEHRLVTLDGLAYSRSFIALKNRYGVFVKFTRLHEFSGSYDGKVYLPLSSDAKMRLYYICMALNYVLIDHYIVYRIDHVFKVTKGMLTAFFMDYALERMDNGSFRGKESIEKCVSAVTLFFYKLTCKYEKYMEIKRAELYRKKETYTTRGKKVDKPVPDFQIRGVPEEKEIFRDIPTKEFEILLRLAVKYTPDIAFAIGLQAFAGLRPGEVCNVRQEKSPKGTGIFFTERDGRLIRADIDLRHEYIMRSDGVVCGRIKKESMQGVYPTFCSAFHTLYKMHKEFLSKHSFEECYCPMFINSKGLAMTYKNYYGRFRKLVDRYLRPELLKHEDPELRIYGQLLCENSLGPHALRHWFSVQLVLRGEDIAQLQYWRGDNNPQSAFDYLMNKGDLINELEEANEMLVRYLDRVYQEGIGEN